LPVETVVGQADFVAVSGVRGPAGVQGDPGVCRPALLKAGEEAQEEETVEGAREEDLDESRS